LNHYFLANRIENSIEKKKEASLQEQETDSYNDNARVYSHTTNL